MRTLSDLQSNTAIRFSSDATEVHGDESLISDIRSHMKSTELVERKLQIALQCNRTRGSRLGSIISN